MSKNMAELTRLELATSRVTGGRSNQLSYSSKPKIFMAVSTFNDHPTSLTVDWPAIRSSKSEVWLLGQDSNLRPND